ncbi:MAG TPA: hydantoinase/oxoprolinase family protein, partial [Candidatus Acidoferrum sp.]|nr:hydantoinase/oxoprolinase family protein [Candidatus Acidoferrum sp.]
VLEIGRQARPKLYDFFVDKAEPLVGARERIGARERLAWDGDVVTELTSREIGRVVRAVGRTRPEAVAICFLFSFRNSRHEARMAAALRRAGYLVSVSHEILPEFREYERTSTTVINAYLAPVMSGYLAGTQSRVRTAWFSGPKPKSFGAPKVRVHIMQSNGGVVSAEKAALEPVTTILSGPAGGVTGAAYAARLAGIEKVITFDMGGTSTDVALLSGELRTTSESTAAGFPVAVPMLEIHTVGAGGGSIARFDRGGALRVGPESAGAEPGPICYGRGELPTVTDAHAVLGHFGGAGLLGGSFPLDLGRARQVMEAAAGKAKSKTKASGPSRPTSAFAFSSVEKFAEGILAVADAVMEKAIRVISVERGHDPRDYALVAFGGAGGLHACSLASALGMRGVLLPIFPGGLSALGILRADVVTEFSRTVLLTVSSTARAKTEIEDGFRSLEREGCRAMSAEEFAAAKIRIERRLDLRYAGQAYELSAPAAGDFVAAFHRAHEARYGYHDAKRTVEIVNLRVRATGVTEKPGLRKIAAAKPGAMRARTSRAIDCVLDGKRCRATLIARDDLRSGDSLSGPAVISEYSATSLVPHGWTGRVDAYGQILLTPKRGGRG